MKKLKNKPPKLKRQKTVTYVLGQKFFIEGVECAVGHVNAGMAWLFPTTDDNDTPLVSRHIVFAKLNEHGIISLYDHAKPVLHDVRKA